MRKSILLMLAVAAALAGVTMTGTRSHAGVIGGPLGLHGAADDLRLAILAVLAGDEVAALNGTLLGVAALALQEQFHALTPAQPADGTCVTRHYRTPSLRRPWLRCVRTLTPSAAWAGGNRCAGSVSRP